MLALLLGHTAMLGLAMGIEAFYQKTLVGSARLDRSELRYSGGAAAFSNSSS